MADIVESLNVLAKEQFGDGVPDLVPDGCKLQKRITLNQKTPELGLKYVQTVRLALPSGITEALGDGSAGAFALNSAVGGTQKRAEVLGSQVLLKDQMSLEDAAKCSSSKQAFVEGTGFFFKGIQKAMRKRVEALLFHGGQGVGTIGSFTGSSTTRVITITAAQWAAGIWSGMEGMNLDVYNGASKINTNAPVVLTSVNIGTKQITVSGNSTDLGNLANGYTLYYLGGYGNEMTGVHGILNNTGSLFNIDASVYSLWQSSQYAPTSGALSYQKIKKAISLAVNRGLEDKLALYVSPGAWDDLASSIEAVRRTDKSEVVKVDVGTEEIVFHSQNGSTEIISSQFVKEGFAYGLQLDSWKRVGASDVTMNYPGFGGEMFFPLQSNAGVESRAYTHQAIFCEMPAPSLIISNIVNSAP